MARRPFPALQIARLIEPLKRFGTPPGETWDYPTKLLPGLMEGPDDQRSLRHDGAEDELEEEA